ncbi:protein MAIN-LIKE 2-like [Phaseolus vulgaris]|uniref:protein MAIN-LIKE 2-like n=1 Tax=Phaseolus vulgaris TaxID=3885 RepID=UPI0035CB9D02
MGAPHPRILPAVELSGLVELVGASYDTIDKGLLCAFVERWHPETNSFHLLVGELTITLDDVSNLLHLPIIGQFYTYLSLDAVAATDLLVDSLRVERGVAAAETRHCQGGHVRLSWLREMYEDACSRRQWTVAARAYLLYLVGCTIFANKSATSVSVSYLGLFVDLRHTGGYSWAAAALTHLYEQLGDGSYANTRQLAGYVTLLASWIYKHFLSIGHRQVRDDYVEDEPWWYIRLRACRQMHLLERVLRQYGYIQCIPRHPANGDPSTSEIDHRWLDFNANLVQGAVLATDVGTCVSAYLEWFQSISHPYIIQMAEDNRPLVITPDGRRQDGNDTISEHPAVGLCRRITSTLQLIIDDGHLTEDSPAWEGTHTALMLARSATEDMSVYVRRRRHVR